MFTIHWFKVWLQNQVFFKLTTRELSVNRKDLGAPTLVGPPRLYQGSGPPRVLDLWFPLFVSPLFDLTQLTNFADDNFYLEWNSDLSLLIINLEQKLEMITKWLRDSGLLVNES